MTVRLLEDYGDYKKGVNNLPQRLAIELISKGHAVKIPEQAQDHSARQVLNEAIEKDGPKE